MAGADRISRDPCPQCGRKNALNVWEPLGDSYVVTYCRYSGCSYETRQPRYKSVAFDRKTLELLKLAVAKAKEDGLGRMDSFIFDGNEYVVGYAEYLIQYLDPIMEKGGTSD